MTDKKIKLSGAYNFRDFGGTVTKKESVSYVGDSIVLMN